jgi:rare lipoprotein A
VKLIGGKFVVLTTKKAMEFGAASWYKYKNCDCAASPDYPKGPRLKVTNLDNNKSLIVKVNDWGPERDKHPERVIDLDKTAFKKLGSLSRGILKNVRVELVKN